MVLHPGSSGPALSCWVVVYHLWLASFSVFSVKNSDTPVFRGPRLNTWRTASEFLRTLILFRPLPLSEVSVESRLKEAG
jgi:hypothetical protein